MKKRLLYVVLLTISFSSIPFAGDRDYGLPEVPASLRSSVRLEWMNPAIKEEVRTVLVSLSSVKLSDADCREVLKIQRVSAIDARDVRSITDSQVQILCQIPDLRWMLVNGKSVTDQTTSYLAHSKKLEMIGLAECKITDAGLAHLAALKHLQTLNLRYTQILGSDLSKLGKFPALEALHCEYTPVDDRICEELVRIKTLNRLHLNGTKISDNAIGSLRRCQSLEELYLGELRQLTLAGFSQLIQLPKLRILNLSHCPVEDVWLDAIPAGSSIERLHLTGDAPYTLAAINSLQRRNPNMAIYHGRIVKPKAKPGQATQTKNKGVRNRISIFGS